MELCSQVLTTRQKNLALHFTILLTKHELCGVSVRLQGQQVTRVFWVCTGTIHFSQYRWELLCDLSWSLGARAWILEPSCSSESRGHLKKKKAPCPGCIPDHLNQILLGWDLASGHFNIFTANAQAVKKPLVNRKLML